MFEIKHELLKNKLKLINYRKLNSSNGYARYMRNQISSVKEENQLNGPHVAEVTVYNYADLVASGQAKNFAIVIFDDDSRYQVFKGDIEIVDIHTQNFLCKDENGYFEGSDVVALTVSKGNDNAMKLFVW